MQISHTYTHVDESHTAMMMMLMGEWVSEWICVYVRVGAWLCVHLYWYWCVRVFVRISSLRSSRRRRRTSMCVKWALSIWIGNRLKRFNIMRTHYTHLYQYFRLSCLITIQIVVCHWIISFRFFFFRTIDGFVFMTKTVGESKTAAKSGDARRATTQITFQHSTLSNANSMLSRSASLVIVFIALLFFTSFVTISCKHVGASHNDSSRSSFIVLAYDSATQKKLKTDKWIPNRRQQRILICETNKKTVFIPTVKCTRNSKKNVTWPNAIRCQINLPPYHLSALHFRFAIEIRSSRHSYSLFRSVSFFTRHLCSFARRFNAISVCPFSILSMWLLLLLRSSCTFTCFRIQKVAFSACNTSTNSFVICMNKLTGGGKKEGRHTQREGEGEKQRDHCFCTKIFHTNHWIDLQCDKFKIVNVKSWFALAE